MGPERIWVENRVEDFAGVLDYPRLRELHAEAEGSQFQGPVEELAAGWKFCATSVQVVHLMMGTFSAVFNGYFGKRVQVWDQMVQAFRDHWAHELNFSVAQHQAFDHMIGAFLRKRSDPNVGKAEEASAELYLQIKGNIELAGAIHAATTNAYCDAYNKFETFQAECLSVLERMELIKRCKKGWYQASNSVEEFAVVSDVASAVFNNPEFVKARLIRNSFTHNSGEITEQLTMRGVPSEGGYIVLKLSDLKELFKLLQSMSIDLMKAINSALLRLPIGEKD